MQLPMIGGFGKANFAILDSQPPLPLPYEVLSVGGALRKIAATKNCPGSYVFWLFLAFMAGLIGTARRFRAWPSFEVPCNLFVAAIGDISDSKTPPFRLLRDHCLEVEGEEVEAIRQAYGYEAAGQHRIIVDRGSAEGILDAGAANPAGLIQAVDELSRLILRRDRHRHILLDGFNGGLTRIDLVTRPGPTAENFLLSLAGTVQTEVYRDAIRRDKDGLIARIIPAWRETVDPEVPEDRLDLEWLRRLARRLRSLHASPTVMLFDSAAKGTYGDWWKAHRKRVAYFEGPLAAFENKLPGTGVRLAGLQSLIEWGVGPDDAPPPETIGEEDALAAITLMEDYLRPTARLIYGEAGVAGAEGGARRLARWILQHKPTRFNARVLYREREVEGLSTAEDMAEATEYLTQINWIKPARKPGKQGRPASDFLVNPAVLAWAEEHGL